MEFEDELLNLLIKSPNSVKIQAIAEKLEFKSPLIKGNEGEIIVIPIIGIAIKTEINKILGLIKEVSDYETSFSWTSMMFPSGS